MINKNSLLLGYISFSILYLVLICIAKENLAWFLKPFLLLFLLLYVYKSYNFLLKKTSLALFFSWIGDIILMFTNKGEFYFIFGLISFLISHVLYISLFLKQGITNNYRKKLRFGLGLL